MRGGGDLRGGAFAPGVILIWVPATVTMPLFDAINRELRLRQPQARRDAIAAHVAEMAGTEFDLDPELEHAGIDHLTAEEGGLKSALDVD
jgi:hypothetical protein